MDRLKGKVAFITGATGGIGRATVPLFIREGAQVFAFARNEAMLRDMMAPYGDAAAFAAGDITKESDIAAAVQGCLERFGRLDVAFANAGIEGAVKPLIEVTAAELDDIYHVNVRGTFLTLRYTAAALVRQRSGSIILNSSVAGFNGFAFLTPYVMSKHAVTGLMRAAAVELSPHGVRVNSIHPSAVDNRMIRSIEEMIAPGAAHLVNEKFRSMIPMGRYATNEEVAKLALFLASDESSFCTGAALPVDGGFSAT